MQNNYYIGLLSGTSLDSIDAALFNITQSTNIAHNLNIELISSRENSIDKSLKNNINNIINNNSEVNLKHLGKLNIQLGLEFANSVNKLLANNLNNLNINNQDIRAIGFHGQTIYHEPNDPYRFTMQLGCADTICAKTNIPVVSNFRQKDMVHQGQGAPLAPLLHQKLFSDPNINRAIINIGGITNVTVLKNSHDSDHNYIASDLGPGNTLLDQFYKLHHSNINHDLEYDQDGLWAASGRVNQKLLNNLLDDPYFNKNWPKSTGREYFNLDWLNNKLKNFHNKSIPEKDIQRTLTELTYNVIYNTIIEIQDIQEVYICGGGAHNKFLMNKLSELLKSQNIILDITNKLNLPVDWVESALFAYLAYCNINQYKLDLKYITGNNTKPCTLGCYYY